jgi:hypothetical protein
MRNVRRTRTTLPALLLLTILAVAFGAHGSRASGNAIPARAAVAAPAQEKYRVFCVNGKVDFGSRTLKDMQWDFGKNVCQLAEFDTYREAKANVRQRGGVGADCRCQ